MNESIKRSTLMFVLTVFAILYFPVVSLAWSGKCVGVTDGDTIKIMHLGKAEKIRLYGIDCPEKGQAFGDRAKQFTSSLVFGKNVDVDPVTVDRYGRTVAWVSVDGNSVNREILKAGFAWHFKKYSHDPDLAQLEVEARTNRLGLWSDPHSIPPWEFRHSRR